MSDTVVIIMFCIAFVIPFVVIVGDDALWERKK